MPDKQVHSLSPRARELLARERNVPEDEALKARALARARLALDAGRESNIGLRIQGQWPPAARSRQLWRTLLVIAAAIGAAGLAAAQLDAWVTRDARTDPAPATIPPAPLKTSAVRAAPPSARLAASPSVPESSSASHAAAPPADGTRSAARQFTSEVQLLEPARTSIAHRDYAAALVLLAKHQREFPNGELAQEREALRVRALWGEGQQSAAKAAAKAFGKRYPRSALLSWMKNESDDGP